MKIAAIQHDIVWKDAAATHDHVDPLIELAARSGASLIVLSEMFSTGFSTVAADIAQAEDGPTTEFVRQRAASHGVWITGSIAVVDGATGEARNRFTAAGPDGQLVLLVDLVTHQRFDLDRRYAAEIEPESATEPDPVLERSSVLFFRSSGRPHVVRRVLRPGDDREERQDQQWYPRT